jgi:hypothetical protein
MAADARRQQDEAEPRSFRSFYVHLSDGPSFGGHLVTDAMDSFEAAILFAERWGPDPDAGQELRLLVVDSFTGERTCFTLDLGSGQLGAC